VPPSALALALGAAVLHASWNVLLAGARDRQAATAVATLAGVALLAPVAIATGGVETAALPFAAASAALHVAYLALLAHAYHGGEIRVVYPVSWGVAPVLVLAVGAAGLGEGASPAQVAGVLAVAVIYAAALWIGGRGPDLRAELRPRAALTGLFLVGAYGLVLGALQLANAAPVAAVRESGVVMAALMAAAFLHEQVGSRRLGGAVLVAGVALG
jgi:uncharacterized membrane protein